MPKTENSEFADLLQLIHSQSPEKWGKLLRYVKTPSHMADGDVGLIGPQGLIQAIEDAHRASLDAATRSDVVRNRFDRVIQKLRGKDSE